MYLWNINALVKDLRENQVPECYKVKYYIFTACLYFFLGNLSTLDALPLLFLFFLGINICRIINRKGDNANFIDRMICLSVPISIRITLFTLLLFAIAMFLGITYMVISGAGSYDVFFRQLILGYIGNDPELTEMLQAIKDICLNIFSFLFFSTYHLMLWLYIKKVSKPIDNNISAN